MNHGQHLVEPWCFGTLNVSHSHEKWLVFVILWFNAVAISYFLDLDRRHHHGRTMVPPWFLRNIHVHWHTPTAVLGCKQLWYTPSPWKYHTAKSTYSTCVRLRNHVHVDQICRRTTIDRLIRSPVVHLHLAAVSDEGYSKELHGSWRRVVRRQPPVIFCPHWRMSSVFGHSVDRNVPWHDGTCALTRCTGESLRRSWRRTDTAACSEW